MEDLVWAALALPTSWSLLSLGREGVGDGEKEDEEEDDDGDDLED